MKPITAFGLFRPRAKGAACRGILARAGLLLAGLLLSGQGWALSNVQVTSFSDAPDPVSATAELTYTITVENGGDMLASDVVVTTDVPTGTSFLSVSDARCAQQGAQVKCLFGALVDTGGGGGSSISYSIRLRVTASGGSVLNSTTTITSASPDANPGNNSALQVTTVTSGTDLAISGGGSATAVGGGPVQYTVNVVNNGPDAASGVRVRYTLPAGVSYASASGGGWSCSAAGQLITCTRGGTAAPGALPQITLNGTVTGSTSGTVTASMTVDATTPDGLPDNNTDTFDTAISSGTDLAITKSATSPQIGGEAVTFTLRPRNNGPIAASTVTVTDSVPVGYAIQSASGTGWTCGIASQVVTCTRASYAVGATNDIAIVATAPASGSYTNTATIGSATTDPVPANNSGSVSAAIAQQQSDLGLTKTKTPNPVAVGSNMISTIVVSNAGPAARMAPIVVTDVLGASETYVSGSGSNWSCVLTVAVAPQTVTCTYSQNIANGGSAPALTVVTRANAAGSLTNNATVLPSGLCATDASQCDLNLVNDSGAVSVTGTAQIADLVLAKTIPDPADNPLVATDNTLTYRLTVTNEGPDDSTGIALRDTLSAYHGSGTGVVVSANTIPGMTCGIAGALVSCNNGALAKDASGYVDITLTRPLKDGAIENVATVNSTDIGDPNRLNNRATVSSDIEPVADIEVVSKTVNPATVKAGVEATYVITVRNNGPSAAAGVAASDTFSVPGGDSGFTFVSAVASNGGSCSGLTAGGSYVGNPALNCTWSGSVASGATRTVTVVVRPNWMAGSAQRQLGNQAVASTTTHDAQPANDSKSATLLIDPAQVDMLVNVTDATAVGAGPDPLGYNPVDLGENVIVYRVTATNNGPSYASGITLTNVFTPPAGKRYTFLCDHDTAAGARQCSPAPAQCDNVGGSYNGVAATITCNAPDGLSSGEGHVRFLAFRIETPPGVGGDVYRLQSTVGRNETDSNAGNDSADETTTVRIRADLALTKVASAARVSLFEPFTWTMTVHNKGPGDSLATTLTDTLPAGMEFTGANPVTPSQGSCTVTGTQFSCDLGTVANGDDATATARVRHTIWPSGGTVTNTARVTTSEVDPTALDNTATGTVTLMRSSLAGLVYFDRAGNGVPDTGTDPGIAGVTLQLSGADAWGNPVTRSATTDVDGNYRFTDLPPAGASGYTVTQTQPVGYHSVRNAAGSAGGTVAGDTITGIVLAAETDAADYLFGETQATGLSGAVYVDGNANGQRDPGEGGIPGVTITLSGTSNSGTPVQCATVTDSAGNYVFPAAGATGVCAAIPPGTYAVIETQPAGFNDGGAIAGDAGGDTSVPNVIGNVVLAANTAASGYLFGEVGTGLSGQVYVDLNDNGQRDAGEPPIADVTIVLEGTDVLGEPVRRTAITDAAGQYAFLNVPGADAAGYTLRETQPAAWGNGKTRAGNIGGTVNGDVVSAIPLGASQYASGYDFGEVGGSLSGTVYLDRNDNGVRDNGEAPLPGVVVTLSGTGADGSTVNITAITDADGRYVFVNLPKAGAGGYTLSETQPVNYGDGKASAGSAGGSASVNSTVGIALAAGAHGTGYDFGDTVAATATLAGKVWIDYDHSRDQDGARTGSGQPGWMVELLRGDSVVAVTQTDAQGNYLFGDVLPSVHVQDHYRLRFTSPKGYVYGAPVSPPPPGQSAFTQFSAPREQREQQDGIVGLYLGAGANVTLQSLPLDPSGVVYDSVRRVPVAGATVRLDGPTGFDPATHLVGGITAQHQSTDASGIYQFLLRPGAPAGIYTLAVTSPAGYAPGASTMIPACASTLTVLSTPNPALVQDSMAPPQSAAPLHAANACPATSPGLASGRGGTQYFLSFVLTPGQSANLVNNHIPVDPILSGALLVRKSTPLTNVQIGDLVPYTIVAQNTLAARLTDVDLRDQLPPGFKYRANSASVDGVRHEPTAAGRALTWSGLDFDAGQTRTVKLLLVVGTGVNEGQYVNQAWAINPLVGTQISNVGSATVRVVPDPLFDCPDVIGKVFDDRNANGYQDDGEPGIPAVRVATPRGLLVTTDAQGRFHVPCPDIPNRDIGSNFVMKLDERTLPSGYRLTTENPRDVRLTRGKLVKLNFGATIHRVVRVELTDDAFAAGDIALAPAWQGQWQALVSQLQPHPSILRLAYRHGGASPELVRQRLDALRRDIVARWHALGDAYPLRIEEEQLEVVQ
ncbi:SdrD B-like domain-containing protein [Chitiniphilus eburneus]|nr:SdrD B-like domain-containing protein [Chitiniphilus eburneus]